MAALVVAVVAGIIFRNRSFSRGQRELAEGRAGLDLEAFTRRLASLGVSVEVGAVVWEALSDCCGPGILPNPSDELDDFYGLDGDHLGDLIEEAFERLCLALPSPERPEIVPELPTARDLCLYLEAKKERNFT